MRRLRGANSVILSVFILLALVFIIKGIMNYFGIEGFQNPWDSFIQQFMQAQKDREAYDLWLGYAYRTSNTDKTAQVLNDMKQRYFNGNCEFRPDWPTPPNDMGVPNGAKDSIIATTAYKTFVSCVQNGNNSCVGKLNDALRRFMKPGCNFAYPFQTMPLTVAFK